MAGTCTGPGVASLGVGVAGILGISIGLGVGSIVVGANGVGGMVVLTGKVNMFLLGTYSVLPTDAGVSGPGNIAKHQNRDGGYAPQDKRRGQDGDVGLLAFP